MRRAIRWAWNGLAAASLLLCVAALAAWPASYWVGGFARVNHELGGEGPPYAMRAVGVDVGKGGLAAWVQSVDGQPYALSMRGNSVYWQRTARGANYPISNIGPRTVEWAGFQVGWEPDNRIGTEVMRWLTAPLWAWAVAFGLLPGWRAMGWYRRRRRVRAGGPAFEVVTREGARATDRCVSGE